ncbi:MAG: DNA polymerase III subunit delta [Planctomycetaceae bacterium]
MAAPLRALDLLGDEAPLSDGAPALVVLHGDDPFLVWHALALLRERLCPDEADRDWAWREFDGAGEIDPRDVFDEAATVPMFATATRAAVVRAADAFVSANREALERLAAAPRRAGRGVVILEVRTFPATTRLAKAALANGLVIETSIPAKADLAGWLRRWSQSHHGIQLAVATAQRLLERLGTDLGQADQALARLAAATPVAARAKPLQPDAIDTIAGTPQERTAWEMIDAAGAGDATAAIVQLDALLAAGENPIGIAAQIASVLRRLSTAARLLALPPDAGRPAGVEPALREAGVAAWPKALGQAREALQQLGARRARRLPVWLLDLDRSLKGEASRGLRARLALERLFCKMARDAGPAGRGGQRPAGARA